MANSTISSIKSEQVVVDTAPASGGYWTNGVATRLRISGNDIEKLFFSARGSGTAVPTLQFRVTTDETWTDFYNAGVAFAIGDVATIEANANEIEWRAGVAEGDYTSGEVQIGLNW